MLKRVLIDTFEDSQLGFRTFRPGPLEAWYRCQIIGPQVIPNPKIGTVDGFCTLHLVRLGQDPMHRYYLLVERDKVLVGLPPSRRPLAATFVLPHDLPSHSSSKTYKALCLFSSPTRGNLQKICRI